MRIMRSYFSQEDGISKYRKWHKWIVKYNEKCATGFHSGTYSAQLTFWITCLILVKNSHQLMAEPLSAVGSVHQYQQIMRKNDPHYHHVIFFNGCGSHFVFNGFIPKVDQIIRNTSRTTIPWMQSNQRFISYRAHKFLGGHLGKWRLMAWCKKIYGMNCPGT